MLGALEVEQVDGEAIIVDLLAGNGTFSRVCKSLLSHKSHLTIGVDVSKTMVADSMQRSESVINCHYSDPILADQIADGVVSAYGTHHIDESDRNVFYQTAKRLVKPGGKVVIQDFCEGTPTEKWYSEVIDTYRVAGHKYKHFTEESLRKGLKSVFNNVDLAYSYDPFCMEFDSDCNDEESVIKSFYIYLISLFSLEKLLPNGVSYNSLTSYDNSQFWKSIHSILEPHFTFNSTDLNSLVCCGDAPVCNKITVFREGGKLKIVAPRVALIGIAEH